MPFDGNPAKFVKPETISLPALVAWLETMPPAEEYCYTDNGMCLIGRYLRSQGHDPVVGSKAWNRRDVRENIPLPFGINNVAIETPRTFGAALSRARQLLATA